MIGEAEAAGAPGSEAAASGAAVPEPATSWAAVSEPAASGGEVPEPAAEVLPELVARLHSLLRGRQQTVAVAESLTGGLLAGALTSTPGASTTFRGGLVVYATDLKATLAGVSESLLTRVGAVDPQVALELARGVRRRLSASWGIGVTGVAGPDAQDGRPVGTVFIAVVGPRQSGETVTELELSGDRNSIRGQCVEHAVALLLNVAGRASI